ncbi:GNAT family N-acetyltransferase [Halobaculum lipolyticum]|uniref:GNAT family N-acetyltransferase n=1 Tax=Halobaculum lipolyticum TaxID=3032001 RepID=A0ABD5WEQ5_9EURY|nr:GNAT family N-acetyltransferase [Halobaculum sp. DT31]
MSDEFSIRRVRPSDATAVATVFEAALHEAGAYHPDAAGSPVDEDLPADYVDPGGDFLACVAAADAPALAGVDLPDGLGVDDGVLVATGAFRPPAAAVRERFADVAPLADRRLAEVKRMHVHPALHRRGIGGRVFDAVAERARAGGYGALVLETTSVQEAALAFYRERGFAEAARATVTPASVAEPITLVFCWRTL